jgi:hypothetical protein
VRRWRLTYRITVRHLRGAPSESYKLRLDSPLKLRTIKKRLSREVQEKRKQARQVKDRGVQVIAERTA